MIGDGRRPNRLTAGGALEQLVDPVHLEMREELKRIAADNVLSAHAAQPFHELVEDLIAEVEVVYHDAILDAVEERRCKDVEVGCANRCCHHVHSTGLRRPVRCNY